jgi:hypothetical protein
LCGLPAALLILSGMIGRLPVLKTALCLILLLGGYVAGLWKIFATPYRSSEYFLQANAVMSSLVTPNDVALIHSIPSAILGVTRYMDSSVPVAVWIEPLQQKHIPDGIQRIIAGKNKVAVLRVHKMARDREPEVDWLNANARFLEFRDGRGFHILVYETRSLKSEELFDESEIAHHSTPADSDLSGGDVAVSGDPAEVNSR